MWVSKNVSEIKLPIIIITQNVLTDQIDRPDEIICTLIMYR